VSKTCCERAAGRDRHQARGLGGSFRTERFSRATVEAAQAFLDGLVSDRDAMIQRWMPSVDTYGERSLVWIDGAVTHAIRKTPRFAVASSRSPARSRSRDDERAFAERALSPFAGELLYARVDMVRDAEARCASWNWSSSSLRSSSSSRSGGSSGSWRR